MFGDRDLWIGDLCVGVVFEGTELNRADGSRWACDSIVALVRIKSSRALWRVQLVAESELSTIAHFFFWI